MLNYSKLIAALERQASDIFFHSPISYTLLQETWDYITHNESFVQRLQHAIIPWPIPRWQHKLDATHTIETYAKPYTILSVDGSQIYPDRHMGISCYMINIGTMVIPYQLPLVPLIMESEPYIFTHAEAIGESHASISIVNAQRLELELQQGYSTAMRIKSIAPHEPLLLLFDGSLIFWHLDDEHIKELFFVRYCTILQQLYDAGIICAWYISMPRTRDLMQLIKLALSDFNINNKEAYQMIEHYTDAALMQMHLSPNTYSTVFEHTGLLYMEYPAHVRPHFVYMHVGDEIARVEFPAWIVQDTTICTRLMQMVFDQVIKGQGYPVALAEAHEQAVIKGPDREFFYTTIEKIGLRYNQKPMMSRKSFRKKYTLF
ncbi:MAG TPA: DNA double-strand break repair nuclease NurA [Candidatus Babeliales bacterium]|nr:DNA double-strand break repair nuclease NurA [Candidatus Babeliales bacterium]